MRREAIMNSNSSQPTSHADWDACPTGTLNSFAQADRQARVQATVKKTAIGLVPTAALLLLVWFGVNSSTKPAEGMGCRSVAISVQSYFQGDLGEETEDRIEAHLANCEMCLRKYERYANENELPFDIQLTAEDRNSLLTYTATFAVIP